MLITDEILRMAHINGLYGSQRIHQLNGDTKKVIEIQRQIEKESDEWRKEREKEMVKNKKYIYYSSDKKYLSLKNEKAWEYRTGKIYPKSFKEKNEE